MYFQDHVPFNHGLLHIHVVFLLTGKREPRGKDKQTRVHSANCGLSRTSVSRFDYGYQLLDVLAPHRFDERIELCIELVLLVTEQLASLRREQNQRVAPVLAREGTRNEALLLK